MKLDEKGRCCGRKPKIYRQEVAKVCHQCKREFKITGGLQVENWAWKMIGDKWTRVDSFGNPKE